MKNPDLIVKITLMCAVISGIVTMYMAMDDFWSFRWGWPLVAFAVLMGTAVAELDTLYPDEAPEPDEDYKKKDPPPGEKIIVLKDTKCPHCGAPLDNPDRCEYCDTPTVLYKKIV